MCETPTDESYSHIHITIICYQFLFIPDFDLLQPYYSGADPGFLKGGAERGENIFGTFLGLKT